MKQLRNLCAATAVALAFCLPAFAGDMWTPCAETPAPTTCIEAANNNRDSLGEQIRQLGLDLIIQAVLPL